MTSQKRPADEGLIKNPAKRLRTDEHYSRTKRVLFYIPDPSAVDKKVKAEFLLCEEFAGICIVVFEAGVYYYNNKIDYGQETIKWAFQEAKKLGYNMTEEIFIAIIFLILVLGRHNRDESNRAMTGDDG